LGVGRRYFLWSEYLLLLLRFSTTYQVGTEIKEITYDEKVWAGKKG
jgi:hypothetical protein